MNSPVSISPSKAKTLFSFLTIFICSLLTFLYSCKGDDGNIGPAGAKGDTGNANVIYSAWKTASSFKDSIVDNSNYKVGTLSAAALTNDLLDKSDIHVYMDYGGGAIPLPYTNNAGGKPNTISFWPKVARITVNRFAHDNSNSVSLSTLLKYRYVIIPGNIAGRTAAPDFNNYHAVCKFYGIPE